MVRKRSWVGLGWEGADEGLLRRGRSGCARAGAQDVCDGLVTATAFAVRRADRRPAQRWRMPYARLRTVAVAYAVPAAGPPANAAVVHTWPSAVVAVYAVPAAGPPEGTATVWVRQLPDRASSGA